MSIGVFLLVLTAAFCHAVWNFVARKVSGNLVVVWLSLLTGCLLLLPVVVGIVVRYPVHESISTLPVRYMVATGVFHAIYFWLLSCAYRYGEISVVYPIARGSGIGLTAVSAWLFLAEEISFLASIGIGMILIGVLSMSRPLQRGGDKTREFLLALCVGVSIVAYSLTDKIGVSKVHPVLYIWSGFLIAGIVLSPFVMISTRKKILRIGKEYWFHILIIGAGAIGTYLMILFAFTMGSVSYVVAIREFAVVVGALLGIIFLKERLTFAKIAAIAAITFGLVCIKLG